MSNSISIGILRLPAVVKKVGLSRSSIYSLVQKNAFPKPVQLSVRAVGWRLADIEVWVQTRAVAGTKEGV